jgi:hypothetical protein
MCRWGTLWLTRVVIATNEPSAARPRSPARASSWRRRRAGDQRAGEVRGGRDVRLGRQQAVAGQQRAAVEEGERDVVLEDDVRGGCSGDDPAERARGARGVSHRGPSDNIIPRRARAARGSWEYIPTEDDLKAATVQFPNT